MTPLTYRQLEVLSFIDSYSKANGFPPTIREIGEELDIRSTNGVNDHLIGLQRKGAITRRPRDSRAIAITADDRTALRAARTVRVAS